jgi:hypothetical protein
LRVLENRVVRNIFGPKRDKEKDTGKDSIVRSYTFCTPH